MADEIHLHQDFEALSVSKRLARSVSQQWRKNIQKPEEQSDNNSTKGGVSMRCLSLYGRGGGCKVGAETSEEYGDPSSRRRSSASEDAKGYGLICGPDEIGVDCFPYGVKERFWRRNNRRDMFLDQIHHVFLPDDILEMCLVRLPLTSLMTARLVCKKWRNLASTPRFLQMRREKLYQNPWLFLFGTVKDGFCSGEIHALDVCQDQWHKIQADVLKGKFMFSLATIHDDVYVVGGCSSLTNFGKVDRSSFKTHKSVLSFSPLTKSWHKLASMKYARSMPVLGSSEVSPEFSISQNSLLRQERRVPRSRLGGVSDVYEDPHRLSLRRQHRSSFDNIEGSPVSCSRTAACNRFSRQKIDQSSNTKGSSKRFVLIVVGGLGSWDEPLDSGEIYDSAINKWSEIPRLPFDFGTACSGVVCNGVFYVYSENDKIMGYDIERSYWVGIQTTTPFPPRVQEYYPKLVSCNNQLFMLSVSWCDGDGQIGRRNKAVRKLWQLDLMDLTWNEVSVHPDAPMDWNAAFVADKNVIFGVEMFKIFGQVLDFVTTWNVSDEGMKKNWRHVSRNQLSHQLDSSSCMTKTLALVYL